MSALKVGIMGAGRIAQVMADTLNRMQEAELYAIASRSIEKAQGFAAEYGAKCAYGSYEDMLEDEQVDLVYIATPHNCHKENAMLCIKHGKPVLVEKPFCVNEREAKEVLDYAREKNVFVTEAMWPRYIPVTQTIKKLLESGIIGEPRMLNANLGYVISGKKRMSDPALAGGALLDVGVYPLNFTYTFFGYDIEKISASAVKTEAGVDEQDCISIIYRDGRMASVNCSMTALSDRMGIIYGTKGFIVVENVNNYQSAAAYGLDRKLIVKEECPPQISGYEYEVLACKEAIESGALSCSEISHEEILFMMRSLDEIRRQIGVKYPFE